LAAPFVWTKFGSKTASNSTAIQMATIALDPQSPGILATSAR